MYYFIFTVCTIVRSEILLYNLIINPFTLILYLRFGTEMKLAQHAAEVGAAQRYSEVSAAQRCDKIVKLAQRSDRSAAIIAQR